MRLCLIPSTICSICLRNCSLLPEEAMALKTYTYTLPTCTCAFRKDMLKLIVKTLAVILRNSYMDPRALFDTHCWK